MKRILSLSSLALVLLFISLISLNCFAESDAKAYINKAHGAADAVKSSDDAQDQEVKKAFEEEEKEPTPSPDDADSDE